MPAQLTRSHRSRYRLVMGCAVLWLSLGCSVAGYRTGVRQPRADGVVPRGGIAVYVTNDHDEDVRFFLLRGSTQIPIGSVGSFSARRFVISPAEAGSSGELRLIAQARGSAARATGAADAVDGAAAWWRLIARWGSRF